MKSAFLAFLAFLLPLLSPAVGSAQEPVARAVPISGTEPQASATVQSYLPTFLTLVVGCVDDPLVMYTYEIPSDDETAFAFALEGILQDDLIENEFECDSFFVLIVEPETSTEELPIVTRNHQLRANEEDETGGERRPTLETAAFRQSGSTATPETEKSASVSGTVLDATGAAIPGAEISLTQIGASKTRSAVSGADGTFTFYELPAGSYIIVIDAKGFQRFTSAEFTLTAQQSFQLPNIALSVAMATAKVVVQPTEVIAAQQMKAEEKQRVLGVLPNFYTSYLWNAAPLDTKQKFSLALRDTFDPFSFVGVSLGAGIQQARNTFPGYGQGAAGYGKRWGALFADGRTSDILSRAVFPSLFHQDPRYFYQGSGSTWSRIEHAIAYSFVARSDSGRLMPNYSYLLGNMSSAALSNLYYPPSSRGASLVFTNAAIGFAGRAAQNLLREFVSKHLTKNVPGNGKPDTNSGNP